MCPGTGLSVLGAVRWGVLMAREGARRQRPAAPSPLCPEPGPGPRALLLTVTVPQLVRSGPGHRPSCPQPLTFCAGSSPRNHSTSQSEASIAPEALTLQGSGLVFSGLCEDFNTPEGPGWGALLCPPRRGLPHGAGPIPATIPFPEGGGCFWFAHYSLPSPKCKPDTQQVLNKH